MDFTTENAEQVGTCSASESLSRGCDKKNLIELRGYQQKAAAAALAAINASRNTVIQAPTGCGKSLIIAAVISASGGRVLVLTHRSEVAVQDHAAFERFSGKSGGVFSAAVRKDNPADHRVIFATIATAYNAMASLGKFFLIVIDEAHLVPGDSDASSRYAELLRYFGDVTRLGLSATPYRLGDGSIYGEGTFFGDGVCFQISAARLVADGYLSPLIGVQIAREIDSSGCRKRGGEFVARDLADLVEDEAAVARAVDEAINAARGRRKILVFGVSILHVQTIAAALVTRGESVAVVHGGLSGMARANALDKFKDGTVRWLANCEVLTTGYDEPGVDAVVLMRPTASKALHTQMLGRGMRLAADKKDCVVIDFAANVARHGNIDELICETRKSEERRRADAEVSKPRPLPKNAVLKSVDLDPVTGLPVHAVIAEITRIEYALQPAKAHPGLHNVVVVYHTRRHGRVRCWLCPEYQTGAAWHARKFAASRGINSWNRSSAWLCHVLKHSPSAPKSVALVRGQGGHWEVSKEIFDDAPHDWFADMRGALGE